MPELGAPRELASDGESWAESLRRKMLVRLPMFLTMSARDDFLRDLSGEEDRLGKGVAGETSGFSAAASTSGDIVDSCGG